MNAIKEIDAKKYLKKSIKFFKVAGGKKMAGRKWRKENSAKKMAGRC